MAQFCSLSASVILQYPRTGMKVYYCNLSISLTTAAWPYENVKREFPNTTYEDVTNVCESVFPLHRRRTDGGHRNHVVI